MKDQIEEAIDKVIVDHKSFPGMSAKEIQDAAALDIKDMYDLLSKNDFGDFFDSPADIPDRLENFSARLMKYAKAMRERT